MFPRAIAFLMVFYAKGNLEAEMEKKGLSVNLVIIYYIRMDALCKRGESQKGARLLDEISEIPSHYL